MYHVLLISEDRLFLKKIYPMLEDEARFCIHVVPFSMDAVSSFKKFHVDAVILDTTVFVPYEQILSELREFQWNYSTILISGHNENLPKAKNLFFIEKENISREVFLDVFEKIFGQTKGTLKEKEISFLQWHGNNSITLNNETYHLVYMRSFAEKKVFTESNIQQFAETIKPYGKFNKVFNTANEFFILLPRQNLKSDFNFAHLTQDAISVFGQNIAILYDPSINSQKVISECKQMKKFSDYAYFFNSKSFCIQDLVGKGNGIEEKILHAQCQQLLQSLLSADPEGAVHIARELYFNSVRQYLNFETLEYIRLQINFFNHLLTKNVFTFEFNCLEEEIEYLLKTDLFNSKDKRKGVQENVALSVLKIYNSFQTNISLEGIAAELKRNKIYLNRIYKENFDMTVLDTLQYLRLEHAKFYLEHTKLKVSEIASRTGFNDIGYFSKFFHHETGFTALEYRAKNVQEN